VLRAVVLATTVGATAFALGLIWWVS
jgi:hypothetical protein